MPSPYSKLQCYLLFVSYILFANPSESFGQGDPVKLESNGAIRYSELRDDGSMFLVGELGEAGSSTLFIASLDPCQNLQWAKYYGAPDSSFKFEDRNYLVTPLYDSTFVICYGQYNFSSPNHISGFYSRFDYDGNIINSVQIEGSEVIMPFMIKSTDGSSVVSCVSIEDSPSVLVRRGAVLKMDSSLNLQWSKEIEQSDAFLGNGVHQIHPLGKKTIFSLGSVPNPPVIGLLDSIGGLLWAIRTNSSYIEEINSLHQNLLLFAKNSSKKPAVFALDSNGLLRWSKAFPEQLIRLRGYWGSYSLISQDSSFYFILNQDYQSGKPIMVKSLFDTAGNLLLQNSFPIWLQRTNPGTDFNYTLSLDSVPFSHIYSLIGQDLAICETSSYKYPVEDFPLELKPISLDIKPGPQLKPYYLPPATGSFSILSSEILCRKSILPKDTTLCFGNILHLEIDSNNVDEILWSTGDTTGSVSIDSSGTYWVKRTFSSCSFTDTIQVKIYEKVLVMLPEDSFVCPGTDVELVAHHQGISFKWYGPNNLEVVSDTIYADAAGLYRVRVADSGGCVDLDTFELKLYPKPVAFAAPDTTICFGDSVTLMGAPQQNCNWSGPSLLSSQCAVTSFPGSTSRYTFRTSNSFGCTDTASVLVQVPEIQINEISPIQFCTNVNPKLIQVKTNDIAVWNWLSTKGKLLDTGKIFDRSYHIVDTVILMGNNNCATPFADTIVVTINDTPYSKVTIFPTLGCEPVNVSFSLQPTNFDQLHIDFGDGIAATFDSAFIRHQYVQEGEYKPKIILTSHEGCSSIISVKETIRAIHVPRADFIINPKPLIVPDTFVLSSISPGSDSIIWFMDGDTLFGNEKKIFVKDSGQYIIQLVALNEFCTDTVQRELRFIGVPFHWFPTAFSPNSDGLNDFFEPVIIGFQPVRMKIFDRWGERIFDSDEVHAFIWDGTTKGILVQEGSYFYVFEVKSSEGKERTFKGIVNIIR